MKQNNLIPVENVVLRPDERLRPAAGVDRGRGGGRTLAAAAVVERAAETFRQRGHGRTQHPPVGLDGQPVGAPAPLPAGPGHPYSPAVP